MAVAAEQLRFTFRPLISPDLSLLHRWLQEPGVVRWWEGEDVSWLAVVADYAPDRPNPDRTEHWIAEIDDDPVGWICCWPVLDGLEESAPWFRFGVSEAAAGIDYLVADPTRRGKGVGSAMIRAFTYNVVFGRHCDWVQVAASPYAANVASCRALENAGFQFAGSIVYPDDEDEGPCSLMVLDRPDVDGMST